MPLTVVINGNQTVFDQLEPGLSLDVLLEVLSVKADRVAIELNGQIARRATWTSTIIKNLDELEIVHFVGGGAFY